MMNLNKLLIVSSFFFISMQVQAREVSDINVKDIGQYDECRGYKHERDVCKHFRPTKKQIIRFPTLQRNQKKVEIYFTSITHLVLRQGK